MSGKAILGFIIVTAAGAVIWTLTADWVEKRKAQQAAAVVTTPGAAVGPRV